MLEKSLTTSSDVIIYDLEDSVPPSPVDKNGARGRLAHFLSVRIPRLGRITFTRDMHLFTRHVQTRADKLPAPERIAIRLNSNTTPFFPDDILQAVCFICCILPACHPPILSTTETARTYDSLPYI